MKVDDPPLGGRRGCEFGERLMQVSGARTCELPVLKMDVMRIRESYD